MYRKCLARECKPIVARGTLVPMLPSSIGLRQRIWRSMTSCSLSTLKRSILASKSGRELVVFCLFDVVERAIRCFSSPQLDLVEFLVRLLRLVLSTKLTQYGGSFFEGTWGLSTGLQCASELANLYLDVLDSHVWQSSGGALKCLFRYINDGFWGPEFEKNHSQTSCSVF